jgi:hypothetical protein
MKKILTLFLVVILCLSVWADATKYLIIFTDGTKNPCYILENDPITKRLKIQCENKVETGWLSYYSVKAIIEASSQKDVTDEFIQPSVKKIESRATIGVDSSVYTYLAISFVAALVFYIIAVNDIKH